MTAGTGAYRVTVAGGLRMATRPLALIAANVAALLARGYRVWVRDADDAVVAIHADAEQFHLSFHPGPGANAPVPPWVDRLSDLLAEISDTPTNHGRSSTP